MQTILWAHYRPAFLFRFFVLPTLQQMLVYRLFILLYPKIVWLLRFTNPKAKLWLSGRSGVFKKLAAAFHKNNRPVIWMHCASLGEFEQGRPVLESLRKKYPSHCILLTFFSPSGYEIRKNYDGADHIFYLPMDSPSNASRFLNIVQPSLVLFVKYEFWYYYLNETKQRNIPLLLVSGIFRKNQLFFKWYGGMHRKNAFVFYLPACTERYISEAFTKHRLYRKCVGKRRYAFRPRDQHRE
jgi:3-deoxy-D-manno-octulosonic-acid transferase